MNTLIKTFGICTAFSLLISGCAGQIVRAEPAEANAAAAVSYHVVLGKPLDDNEVANFIATNHCSPAAEYLLCQDAGMALWTNSDLVVKTVNLYSGDTNGFRRYRGQLPYGLSFYDPMWLVEEKLRALEMDDKSMPTFKAGLPDEASSPDHFHYWAMYKRFGMTVIYNAPAPDEDAYIYAIVVHK